MVGYFLVRKFAPEAGGSGIPEIEGALEELRPVRWWRVLPVKFIGGMGTLGAGMVLGREGPTVQLGGNVGRMVGDLFRMRSAEARHTLLATVPMRQLSTALTAFSNATPTSPASVPTTAAATRMANGVLSRLSSRRILTRCFARVNCCCSKEGVFSFITCSVSSYKRPQGFYQRQSPRPLKNT